MAKRTLTDRLLKSLRPAKPSQRIEIMDSVVPGLAVRVTDNGAKSFVLVHRFPGGRNPVRRKLGTVGAIGLADARQLARDWLKLIGQGKDPAEEAQRIQRERQGRQDNTFAAVAEVYIVQMIERQRKAAEVKRVIRQVLIPLWGGRPITEIGRGDVLAVIEGIRDLGTAAMLAAHGLGAKRKIKPAPNQARNVLGYLRTFFSWAIERGTYGLESSPCDHLRSARIVGAKHSRDRILSDEELFACWRAAGRLSYPAGPLYQLLLLTALRLNEAADAVWNEFDFGKQLWTIPAERMKGRVGKARAHAVPLSTSAIRLLEKLPRGRRGAHVFSTTFGERPAWVSSKIKQRLDQRMLRTLRAMARHRGEDPAKVVLAPWVNHDLRRTVRSGLTQLRIHPDVAEAILAHAKSGIRAVYDRFEFVDEKRTALERWAQHLHQLSGPPASNVIKLAASA